MCFNKFIFISYQEVYLFFFLSTWYCYRIVIFLNFPPVFPKVGLYVFGSFEQGFVHLNTLFHLNLG